MNNSSLRTNYGNRQVGFGISTHRLGKLMNDYGISLHLAESKKTSWLAGCLTIDGKDIVIREKGYLKQICNKFIHAYGKNRDEILKAIAESIKKGDKLYAGNIGSDNFKFLAYV